MSLIIKSKKTKKPLLNKSQKAFNRLRKKVEVLQFKLESLQKELNESLRFYYQAIEPKQQVLKDVLTKIVNILYNQYKNLKKLSKNERNILKEMIASLVAKIMGLSGIMNDDPQIAAIIKDLEGVDYNDFLSQKLNGLKEDFQAACKERGIDIDIDIDFTGHNEQEIMEKIAEALQDAKSKMEEEPPLTKPKSKKAIERELKEKKLETMQKQSLNGIYKQLAKVLHPDLEQDVELKNKKVELMKKLTIAYKNKDLHTLLFLEMEWMNPLDKQHKEQSEEQLKIYNSILGEQVEALQQELYITVMHPKYFPIHPYLQDVVDNPISTLNDAYREIKDELEYFQEVLTQLESEDILKMIRVIIRSF
jgi:hypothetical protein